MKILIIFIYLITTSFVYAIEKPDIKNIVINQNPKIYENITFKDFHKNDVDLSDYKEKLLILNFWATWCAPCKEEMPSLDTLQSDSRFNNLLIFPINVGQEDLNKSKIFFEELNIKNLNIYFDNPKTLANVLALRGIPTTVLLNKEGEEFARIIGSIDFGDEEFLKWIKLYD